MNAEEEYQLWARNAPFLYDTVITHVLEWPSPTVEWIGTSDTTRDYVVHKLLLGTHTSAGDPNQLIIANTKLPKYDSPNNPTAEVLSEGLPSRTENKVEQISWIHHEGEVNRARTMPQQANIVATRGPNPNIFIYDYNKHPQKSMLGPQIVLQGHSREGLGMAWNPLSEGLLATSSTDASVCIWDITKQTQPMHVLAAHSDRVNDVAWRLDRNVLASVSHDKKVILWDIRQETPTLEIEGHGSEIHTIDFNRVNDQLFSTGSSDTSLGIWDLRNPALKVCKLEHHTEGVYGTRWAPMNDSLLASFSSDRRVLIWDISKVGQQATEHGPSELVFIHGGHTARVSDLTWSANEKNLLASVAEDNIVQVWQVSEEVMS